ncbi:probable aquaporin NIP7-1 [Rhodamnia argentea]|uniref:Probable aquaporin NIP7-1 n=1 Tax=Rhodamnia argentea TaxID=178133 RepID=A0A8B8QLZ4_9MYRT|nr:probable aquaporin NIP7-1 [Rhodamnia argentea]
MTTGLNMNRFPEEAASPASSPSMEDQESGRNVLPRSRDCSTLKDFILGRSPQGTTLNTARMVLAEAVGTFILMYCISAIVSITQLLKGEVGLMGYAATAGMTIVVVIFSLGPISDAHINPAITIAFAIYGHFPWSRVPLYIIAQMTGSVLATYVGALVYGVESSLMITRPLGGPASAFWVEFLATFIMVFLIAGLTYNHRSVGQLSGFVMGTGIGLAVVIAGPVSGASMNPARSLGPAIVSWDFESIWIYITAPVTGSIVGGFVYRLLRLQGQVSSSAASSPNASLLIYSQEAL